MNLDKKCYQYLCILINNILETHIAMVKSSFWGSLVFIFHEEFYSVYSIHLLEKTFSHNNHICDLCGLHELCGCEFSKCLLQKIIYHKIHICDLYGLHELCGCVSLIYWMKTRIHHKNHICGLLFFLREQSEYVFLNCFFEKITCHMIHI